MTVQDFDDVALGDVALGGLDGISGAADDVPAGVAGGTFGGIAGVALARPHHDGRPLGAGARERQHDRQDEHDQHQPDHHDVGHRQVDEAPVDRMRRVIQVEDRCLNHAHAPPLGIGRCSDPMRNPGSGASVENPHPSGDSSRRSFVLQSRSRTYTSAYRQTVTPSGVKTAISLSDETFQRVDRAAKRLGLSRSELFARTAESWLDSLEEDDV